MKKLALLLILLTAVVTEAKPTSQALEQRLKDSYSTMVVNVRQAPTATEKRAILDGFLSRMDRGLGVVETLLPASNNSHQAASNMRTRIQADRTELATIDVQGASAASSLNGFASYIQQDVEQADGVYLSVGAILIILIIVIILF